MKFLIAFLVPEDLDSMLLKLCKLILPRFIFQGCTMVWFCELHYREKNSQQYVALHTEMSYTLVFQILGILFLEYVVKK